MERDFTKLTQQEYQILEQARKILHTRGISIEENDEGRPNILLIFRPFLDQSVPLTVDGILSVANQLVDKLHYVSREAKEFNGWLAKMTSDEVAHLQQFLSRKPLIPIDGTKEGFVNASLLVEYCRRNNLTIDANYGRGGLEQAMQKYLPGLQETTGARHLYWKEPQKEDRTYVAGRKNHAAFAEEPQAPQTQDSGREWVNGRRNHAYAPDRPTPATPALDESEQAWKTMAEATLGTGRVHSQNQELQETYNVATAAGRSWRYVFDQLAAVKRQQRMRSY